MPREDRCLHVCSSCPPKTYQRLARLRREAEKDGAYRVAKRLHAVLLNADGHSSGRIAHILRLPSGWPTMRAMARKRFSRVSVREGRRVFFTNEIRCSMPTPTVDFWKTSRDNSENRARFLCRTMRPTTKTRTSGHGSRRICIGWKFTSCRRTRRNSTQRSACGNTPSGPERTIVISSPRTNYSARSLAYLEPCRNNRKLFAATCVLFADHYVHLIMRGCISRKSPRSIIEICNTYYQRNMSLKWAY